MFMYVGGFSSSPVDLGPAGDLGISAELRTSVNYILEDAPIHLHYCFNYPLILAAGFDTDIYVRHFASV